MTVLGFNFTKIGAQRFVAATKKISIQNNISIRNIEEAKIGNDEKRKTLRITFLYDVLYEPKAAHIQLEGNILLLLERKQAEELVKGWAEKKVSTTALTAIMNQVLERCTIEALILARELNLPSPTALPKVNLSAVSKVKNVKKGKSETADPKK